MALNVRVAMGVLFIKVILGLCDRAVVEFVSENPYLQYFFGSKHFQTEPPFNVSLMTHFRKRLSAEVINRFNEKIIELARKDSSPDDDPPPKVVDSDILKQQLTDNAIEGKFSNTNAV